MSSPKRRLAAIFAFDETAPREFSTSLFTFLWGAWYAAPWTNRPTPVFEGVSHFAIGLAMMGVGALMMVALLYGSLDHRYAAGVVVAAAWGAVAFSYIYIDYGAQANAVYPFVVLSTVWTVSRVGAIRRFARAA